MTFKKVCQVNDNQVVVTLPPNFENRKKVTVLIDDQVDTREQKLNLLKDASKDPLFLADISEVNKDFDSIDNDTI
jgi:hypothetical protein